MTARAQTVTILFTDLVGSTELLQRAGDEQAQRIFKAHHRLLREAVESHGGQEVKWLGDGLMVAFDSAADAVKCAVAMQQMSRRPTAGERLEIRAGLNVGEAFVDESDFFGTSVVIARRLCDKGNAGQILASDIVVRLLDGRGVEINTKDLGALELKGITKPVPAVEIVYEHDPMALLRKLPFVGRQAEFATLLKKLAEARNGRGSVVLLAGEPGIGKTRLTEEFCEHASSGGIVIRGNCYEGDVAAPFGPWTQALRSLVEQTADNDLREVLGPGAPDIAVLIPQLKARIAELEESPKLDPESERARLFESISSWLRNFADRHPLVVFVDDLHWCDRPSLALLEQLARESTDRSIVIIGTYRDVEVDRVHPLAQTLAALRRMEHHERIGLHGFTQASVYDLLSAIEPSDQAEPAKQALSAVLHQESEGNPFFIREVLNNLVETGKLSHEGGVWTGTVASIEELGIPEGVKEVIGRRLSRLSDTCNRMLGRASAMTSGFTWDELRGICDESEDGLLDALDEALGSQLIAERSHSTYAFTHALIRATLYDELSTPRRVQLHRRVAEMLESLYAGDIDDRLGELAAHYMASTGNAAEKAIEYSIRAGDRAKEMFAWEEAASHYERALEAMEVSRSSTADDRCRLLLVLAGCNHHSGRHDANVELLRGAAALARDRSSTELFAQAAIAFEQSAQRMELDLTAERLALLDEALAMMKHEQTRWKALALAHRVEAAAAFANSRAGIPSAGFLAWAGEKDEDVLAQAREAVVLAEHVGEDLVAANAMFYLHAYGWSPDNDADRLELVDRGLEAALRAGSSHWEVQLLAQRASDLLSLGDIDEFGRNAEHFSELVTRLRYRPGEYLVSAMRVAMEVAHGQLGAAEQHLAEVPAYQMQDPTAAVVAVSQRCALRYLQGRLEEMEDIWRVVVARWPGVHVMTSAMAVINVSTGKVSEVAEHMERMANGELATVPRDFLWRPAVYLGADACAEIEHKGGALAFYDAALPYARNAAAINQVFPLGSMARVVGRLATVLERWDEAEQHFEYALDHNARMGFHAWTAWTRLNYGDMLVRRDRRGDRDRAVALFNEAHAFANEAHMGKVERDSERLLSNMNEA